MKEEKEFYSIGRGSLNLNGKFYYGLDYAITDFMRSLEEENKSLQSQLKAKEEENRQLKADYGNLAQVERDLLLEENKKYKEVIDKLKELIIDNIEETTYEYIGSNKIKVLQKLIMDNDGVNELLDILKEVE